MKRHKLTELEREFFQFFTALMELSFWGFFSILAIWTLRKISGGC